METIHVSVLRALAERAKLLAAEAIDEIIDAIDTKILVGDIHRPAEKKGEEEKSSKAESPGFPGTEIASAIGRPARSRQEQPFLWRSEEGKKKERSR